MAHYTPNIKVRTLRKPRNERNNLLDWIDLTATCGNSSLHEHPHTLHGYMQGAGVVHYITNSGGVDGTRTRDPLRDRQVF